MCEHAYMHTYTHARMHTHTHTHTHTREKTESNTDWPDALTSTTACTATFQSIWVKPYMYE